MSTTTAARREAPAAASTTERLHQELTRIVEAHRAGTRLVRLSRSEVLAHSSWAVERLVLDLSDGSTEQLVWKDLTREAPGSRARTVKPDRVSDPRREPWVYANVLDPIGEGPALRGIVTDEDRDIHWLFLRDVPAVPLWQASNRTAWTDTASWLARFHARFMGRPPRSPLLLDQQLRLHRWWFTRALALTPCGPDPNQVHFRRQALRRIAPTHRAALQRVMAEPPTFLHGEFYPANILVAPRGESTEIVPVDWEMSGAGPAVVDLAALTTGEWSDADRLELVAAYSRARSEAGAPCLPMEELLESVEAARLLLAVQWLGWADDTWHPPSDLATNWLEEAVRAADRLSA